MVWHYWAGPQSTFFSKSPFGSSPIYCCCVADADAEDVVVKLIEKGKMPDKP